MITILLTLALSACAPQSLPTPIIESTQALQIPAPSDWAGSITHADGTSESIIVHFNEIGGTLNIEPQTKTYEIKDIQRSHSVISFKVTVQNEIGFSGNFDGIQITGQAEQPAKQPRLPCCPYLPK